MTDEGVPERGAGAESCACGGGGASLRVLHDVQRAYERKMAVVERVANNDTKLQMQVETLRAWVRDVSAQNSLLARALDGLERDTAAALQRARAKHAEVEMELRAEVAVLRRRLARKDSDMQGLVEVLRRLREFDYCGLNDGIHFYEVTESDIFGPVHLHHKKLEQGDGNPEDTPWKTELSKVKGSRNCEKKQQQSDCSAELKMMVENLQKKILAKDKEIRRLNKELQQYDQKMSQLKNELSLNNFYTPAVSKRDAETMAGMCGAGSECNADSVKAWRASEASMVAEVRVLRRACGALHDQCHAARLASQFKDEIIREMRRQLKQAKTKLKDLEIDTFNYKRDYRCGDKNFSLEPRYQFESIMAACVLQPEGRGGEPAPEVPLHPEPDDSPRFGVSADDNLSVKTN